MTVGMKSQRTNKILRNELSTSVPQSVVVKRAEYKNHSIASSNQVGSISE